MVRKPPDILITTPESLHLLLTSRARGMLRAVSHVIVPPRDISFDEAKNDFTGEGLIPD